MSDRIEWSGVPANNMNDFDYQMLMNGEVFTDKDGNVIDPDRITIAIPENCKPEIEKTLSLKYPGSTINRSKYIENKIIVLTGDPMQDYLNKMEDRLKEFRL